MEKVVSFSGGRTSAYLCKVMIEKFGRENVDFVFMDTGAEHPKTYEFIKNANDHFNLNLTCLRGDFSLPIGKGVGYKTVDISECKPDLKPYSEMMSKYGVPYIGGMFCTDRMKLKPYKKYCDDVSERGYETWLGIRLDEPARFLGSELYRILNNNFELDLYDLICIYESVKYDGPSSLRHWFGLIPKEAHNNLFKAARKLHEKMKKSNIMYMAEITDFDKQDVLNFWAKAPFDLGVDEWLGNCVFCPKKSNLKLAAAQRDEPEMYHDFLEVLSDDLVRIDNKTGVKEMMYRGKKSLQQVVAMFNGSTGEEIKSRIRGAKMIDTNSCSESCEVFNDETV